MSERPVYVDFIDLHFGALMSIAQKIAEHTGNTTLEIVSRSIPLIVPVPNALGVYNAALTSLHWSSNAALALSLAVECIFFIMFEITLKLWDGYQEDKQHKYPFFFMCFVSFVCVVVVMGIVYNIEAMAGGATVLALLPVLSACTSVGVGFLRWHSKRIALVKDSKRLVASTDSVPGVSIIEDNNTEHTQVLDVESTWEADTTAQVVANKADPILQPASAVNVDNATKHDATTIAILKAIESGSTTPYAISKATGIVQTTLKRKKSDGTYVGRLPQLVASGVLSNGGSDYKIKG